MMRQINGNQLKQLIKGRPANKRLTVSECYLADCDLSGWDLSNIDFSLTAFQGVILNHVNFSNSSLENARLDGCPLRQVTFINANLRCTSLRRCDLTGSNLTELEEAAETLREALLNVDYTGIGGKFDYSDGSGDGLEGCNLYAIVDGKNVPFETFLADLNNQ